MNDDAPLLTVTQAAELAGMHPQTLRQYDRLGLVVPRRTLGRGRRYSRRDVAHLLEVQRLAQVEGINLAGIKRILDLERHVTSLERQLAQLLAYQAEQYQAERRVFAAGTEGDVVVVQRGRRVRVEPRAVSGSRIDAGALVLWRPGRASD
ncbi:MAG: helix-turn-helix transcriptional regulator [Promicromonosporaceae bacterium]|nr:helix-turn-helix transcriptional regulator [Promicromonosporaceae bacterium]